MRCFFWSGAASAACVGNEHAFVALGDRQSLETVFPSLFSLQSISRRRSWPDVVMADLQIRAAFPRSGVLWVVRLSGPQFHSSPSACYSPQQKPFSALLPEVRLCFFLILQRFALLLIQSRRGNVINQSA